MPQQCKRFKTVELIGILIELIEIHLRNRAKMAGGKWNPNLKLWEISYRRMCKLGGD